MLRVGPERRIQPRNARINPLQRHVARARVAIDDAVAKPPLPWHGRRLVQLVPLLSNRRPVLLRQTCLFLLPPYYSETDKPAFPPRRNKHVRRKERQKRKGGGRRPRLQKQGKVACPRPKRRIRPHRNQHLPQIAVQPPNAYPGLQQQDGQLLAQLKPLRRPHQPKEFAVQRRALANRRGDRPVGPPPPPLPRQLAELKSLHRRNKRVKIRKHVARARHKSLLRTPEKPDAYFLPLRLHAHRRRLNALVTGAKPQLRRPQLPLLPLAVQPPPLSHPLLVQKAAVRPPLLPNPLRNALNKLRNQLVRLKKPVSTVAPNQPAAVNGFKAKVPPP